MDLTCDLIIDSLKLSFRKVKLKPTSKSVKAAESHKKIMRIKTGEKKKDRK